MGFKVSATALDGKFSGLTLPAERQGKDSGLMVQATRPHQKNSQPPFLWTIRTDAFPKHRYTCVQASPWKTKYFPQQDVLFSVWLYS